MVFGGPFGKAGEALVGAAVGSMGGFGEGVEAARVGISGSGHGTSPSW